MTDHDRPAFARVLGVLGEVYGEPMSDLRAEAYFGALSEFSIAAIERAAQQAIRSLKFFPKPAELRELLEGSEADQTEAAWLAVVGEVRRVGWTGTPRLDDAALQTVRAVWGGWEALCYALPAGGPEFLGWAKRFKDAYGAQRVTRLALKASRPMAELR